MKKQQKNYQLMLRCGKMIFELGRCDNPEDVRPIFEKYYKAQKKYEK